MKKIATVTFVLFMLFYSCGNAQKKQEGETKSANNTKLIVDKFEEDAENYVGQEVMISGKVTHVCRHGGKRMFITGENKEKTVRITTGDRISRFETSLEGSMISVKGVVKELIIDEAYLAEWESEVTKGTGKENEESMVSQDDYLKYQAEMEGGDPLAQIQKLRDEIKASGKDHLTDYWVEVVEFTINE